MPSPASYYHCVLKIFYEYQTNLLTRFFVDAQLHFAIGALTKFAAYFKSEIKKPLSTYVTSTIR